MTEAYFNTAVTFSKIVMVVTCYSDDIAHVSWSKILDAPCRPVWITYMQFIRNNEQFLSRLTIYAVRKGARFSFICCNEYSKNKSSIISFSAIFVKYSLILICSTNPDARVSHQYHIIKGYLSSMERISIISGPTFLPSIFCAVHVQFDGASDSVKHRYWEEGRQLEGPQGAQCWLLGGKGYTCSMVQFCFLK